MNETPKRLSAAELAELEAYLAARQRGDEPSPGEAGFPGGMAGELLELAQQTHPDPVFAARLEQRLRRAARAASQAEAESSLAGRLKALWQTPTQPERKTAMKRLTVFALAGMLVLAILFVSMQLFGGPPAPPEVALATPPTQTPAAGLATPGAETPVLPTVEPVQTQPPVAINFTPQPLPAEPPVLPLLAQASGLGYGGSGGGNLPAGMPVSLTAELPAGPAEVTAYYRLENAPLTMEEASQLAAQWRLEAQLYLPMWMLNVTPDQTERSYYAIDGMQMLSIWNNELSYSDLALFPSYEGHQYPQSGLPSAEQALVAATQYLSERGFLTYPYQADLNGYAYGLVNFYRLLDGLRIDYPAAYAKINPQGQVGSAWISREDYQSVGSYPVISAQEAWEMLLAGEPSERLRVSAYPAQDGNPQYWGRIYPAGETAHLFGAPVLLPSAEAGGAPYIQLNNLILAGDLPGLAGYMQSNQGYIHVWGAVQEVDGERQLQVSGWESFDEFSGYFNGTVRRTAEGDFLELEDGRRLRMPGLPADVPADIPLYAQGGLVDSTLEWFILQVHPADEGQMPPDLSRAQAVIDQVELVYLIPGTNNMTPEQALDPAYRMLLPAWRFTGRITTPEGVEMVYRAYVGAAVNP
jgi:hypothetical protein